jgi:hypothetical protein
MGMKTTAFVSALESGPYSNWTVAFTAYLIDEWRKVDADRQSRVVEVVTLAGESTALVNNLVFVMIADIVRLRAERVLTEHEATCHHRLWTIASAAVRGRIQELAMEAGWYPTRGSVGEVRVS